MPGHNNWISTNLKLGINIKETPFEIELSVPPTITNDFELASDLTAKLIADQFENLHLCLSGGMDSEYVAMVFMRNKISFTPVILKTKDNLGEAWYAEHFCYRNQLDPVILDYTDKNNQLLRKIFEYSTQASINPTVSFFPHVIADYIGPQGGSLVTGYGEPFCNSNNYSVVTNDCLEIEEHDFYLDVSFGNQHPGGFLSYTPDMFFSLIANMPLGVNIQVAKERLYHIPGRSKIVSPITFPAFIPDKEHVFKNEKLRCIKTTRSDILSCINTQSTIKLSCV